MFADPGINSCSISSRFGSSGVVRTYVPVTLPVGRLKLVTRPDETGSPPVVKTIGMLLVAALAAKAVGKLAGCRNHGRPQLDEFGS